MNVREWQIGVTGTFDLRNYGDLLFPLLAEAELKARLGAVRLHRFSYNSRTPPDWPYPVTSTADLPDLAPRLDGLLIGGGYLIRFDKTVAPGYGPPSPAIHHPTGYWLTPALIALQSGLPLVWNGPGLHRNDIPAWAHPLMELALTQSRYVAVRDQPTRTALQPFATSSPVTVIPDTAFGLSRLLGNEPTSDLIRLREAAGLAGPYIVVQAAAGLKFFLRFLKRHAERFRGFQLVALPVGPALGDDAEILRSELPGLVQLPDWPHPLLMAELIRHAEAVVGHSYHLAITALTAGVPVFTPQDLTAGKYSALLAFERMFQLDPRAPEIDPDWFLARVGRTAPSAAARAALDELAAHWDRVAAALQSGPVDALPAFNRFWQTLPGRLEVPNDLLARSRQEVAALYTSNSWKLTSPLRFLGRWLRGKTEGRP